MIRPKERVLVLLILGTFGFVSFATIWYLPDKQMNGANANKVYNVYKKMEEAGRDLILPPPPQVSYGLTCLLPHTSIILL